MYVCVWLASKAPIIVGRWCTLEKIYCKFYLCKVREWVKREKNVADETFTMRKPKTAHTS